MSYEPRAMPARFSITNERFLYCFTPFHFLLIYFLMQKDGRYMRLISRQTVMKPSRTRRRA